MRQVSRIGVFGGTFNPPHLAHMSMAAAARDQLGLDRVEMLVSARPPHRDAPAVGALDRFAMTVLACDALADVVASPREILRDGLSYTVDTLEELGRETANAELFLIIGKDSYDDLPNWHRPERILELAHLAVVGRPGSGGRESLRSADTARLRETWTSLETGTRSVYWIDMVPMAISASEIRRRVGRGEPAADVCPAVARYIDDHGLYGQKETGETA